MAELDDINAELAELDKLDAQQTQPVQSQVVQQDSSVPNNLASINAELAELDKEENEFNNSLKTLPPEWGDVPLEALRNVPRSAIDFGKNIWQAITSPVETGKALGKTALGGIQKAIPGEQGSEASFDQAVDFFKERYGGDANIRQTISQDPVGFLSDVVSVLGGVGTGLSVAGKISKVGQLSKAGQTVSKVAQFADPIGASTKTVAGVANKVIPDRVRSLTKSAIKPKEGFSKVAETTKLKNVDELANEFIDRGLKVDRKSVAKLGEQIKGVQGEVKDIINAGEKQGIRILVSDVSGGLNKLINELESIGIESKAGINNVKRFRDKLVSSKKVSAGGVVQGKVPTMSPVEVQQLKKLLNKTFTPDLTSSVDAVRKVAKEKVRVATKSLLEKDFPQLKDLNANQQTMINLQETIAKRIRQIEGSKTFSVPGLAIGALAGAGSAVTFGTQGASTLSTIAGGLTFAGLAFVSAKILESPNVQLALAKALNQANVNAARVGKLNKITQPAFQAGRIANEQQDTNRKTNISTSQ
jgi:hypothetical protein